MGGDGPSLSVDDGLNFLANVGTGGLVGYENGSLTPGYLPRAADEGLGEVTGRNAFRDYAQAQQDAINDQKKKNADAAAYELQQRQAADTAASNAAGIDSSNRRLRALLAQQGQMTGASGLGGNSTASYLGL